MIFKVLYIFLVVGPIGPLVNSTTLLSSMALTWAAIAFADKLLLRRPRIHATMASLPVANSKQASKREGEHSNSMETSENNIEWWDDSHDSYD